MKLKDFLLYLGEDTWVDVVHGCTVYGTYSVREFLLKKEPILELSVEKKGVTARMDRCENIVANDSELRGEFFQKDKEMPYIEIYVE